MDLYILRTITFWSIMGLSALSLAYPWRLASKASRAALHLPWGILFIVALHEGLMPAMEHRVDLLAIITASGPVFGVYVFRVCLFGEFFERKGKELRSLSDATRSERRALLPFGDASDEEKLKLLEERR